MHIVLVSKAPLPALTYGGVERVIWSLGKEFAKAGHKVTFLAARGTESPFADVVEIDPEKDLYSQIPRNADIVHFHFDVPEEALDIPHVVMIQGNKAGDVINRNAIFVSRNHAERFSSSSYVYNGMDWDDYGPADLSLLRKGYHFLAKAAWKVKNLRGAIDVVKSLDGQRLTVMGGNRINLKMGVKIYLTPKARFEGMVGNERKKHVIERSSGLLFPVTWHEPFGIAVTESLYFGSPVFATPYGSLTELVAPDVGYLTDSRSDMVRFIKEGRSFDPKVCHEYARDLFNSKIMADRYMEKYETVLNGRFLNDNPPVSPKEYRELPWKD